MGQTWYSKIAKQRADNAKNTPLLNKGHKGDDSGHTHKEADVEGNFKNTEGNQVKIKTNTVFDAGTAKVEGVEGQDAKTRLSWSDAWKEDLEGIQGMYENEAAYIAYMKEQIKEDPAGHEARIQAVTGRDSIGVTPKIDEVKEVNKIDPSAIGQTFTETVIKDKVKDPQVWNSGYPSTVQGNWAEASQRRGGKRKGTRAERDIRRYEEGSRGFLGIGKGKGKGNLTSNVIAAGKITGKKIKGLKYDKDIITGDENQKVTDTMREAASLVSQNKNASPKDLYSGGGADETINKKAGEDATVFKPQTFTTDFNDPNFGKNDVDEDPPADKNPVNAGKPAYKLKNALKLKRGIGY